MDSRQVVVVAYDGVELVDIACLTTPLFMAGTMGADPPYRIRLATRCGGVVHSLSGLQVVAQERLQDIDVDLDTLIVSGGLGHEEAALNSVLVGHVRRLAARSRRVASVCTGATVLAERPGSSTGGGRPRTGCTPNGWRPATHASASTLLPSTYATVASRAPAA